MNAASSSEGKRSVDTSAVRIGALIPLSRPGWVEAGRHLLSGLELGVCDINRAGGIIGRPLELLVRDTAADPQRAIAVVDELYSLGVAALAGEYHSVVARAVASRADSIGLPFLCSSAVLDALTDQPTNWVARLAPMQSYGWQVYADFLINAGHARIAVAVEPSAYWASGIRILRDYLGPRGGDVIELDMRTLPPVALCDELASIRTKTLLLLVGYPEPAISIVESVRRDSRLAGVTIGAPAGQPEFGGWTTQQQAALRERLGEAPSFVAFEGYDTIAALAEAMRSHGTGRARIAESWSSIAVDGTRGIISFSRVTGTGVWQWARPPVQVVDRDPASPDSFRIRYAR
jgi:hypothetical protein